MFFAFLFSTASAELLTVEQAVWTSGVNQRQPVSVVESSAGKGSLYLWTNLRGDEQTLEVLAEKGKLPIRHRWYTYLGWIQHLEELRNPTDSINLTVGKREKLEKTLS